MKNFLFISCSNKFGGAEIVFKQTIELFSKNNNVKLIINKDLKVNFPENEIIFNFKKYVKISSSKIGFLYYFLSSIYIRLNYKIFLNSIIYCNDLESVILSIVLKKNNDKLIWHVHDNYNINKKHVYFMFRFLNLFVDEYICLTNVSCERLKLIVGDKVKVLNNFSRFDPSSPKIMHRNKIVLGFAGQITKWKGVHKAVALSKELHKSHNGKVELKIIGQPYFDDDVTYYLELREKTIKQNWISWNDSKSNLSDFYSNLDFLLCMSDNEPFGLVIVEAMSQGTPVIAIRGDGPNEIISNLENGILLNNNKDFNSLIDDFVNGILQINQEKYYQMSEKCLLNVIDKYTKERYNSNLLKLLNIA